MFCNLKLIINLFFYLSDRYCNKLVHLKLELRSFLSADMDAAKYPFLNNLKSLDIHAWEYVRGMLVLL